MCSCRSFARKDVSAPRSPIANPRLALPQVVHHVLVCHTGRQAERLATGHMRRPMLLRHVGQRLQHLVLADAQLKDLSALSGALACA